MQHELYGIKAKVLQIVVYFLDIYSVQTVQTNSSPLHSFAIALCLLAIPCDDGNVQLVNGLSQYNGRVEVCINGDYYTVCDYHWTSEDASVTCKQLGYDSKGEKIIQGFVSWLINHVDILV